MQLTQSQLAVELGVAHETIDGWEKGRIRPSQLALRQICSVLYQLRQSSSTTLRNGSAALFKKYLNQSSSPSGRIGESAKSNPLSD
jgi:putative transcriptional regulator